MEYTGERYMPDSVTEYDMTAEHIHRYSAASLCVKDKIVVDIASGEGYGSAMFAETAKKVYGFDIDEEAVKHASEKYKKSNLEYAVGNVCNIPLNDDAADVLVSFETIEHVDKDSQKKFVSEAKRVLKDDGVFIVSTPNRKLFNNQNVFHIHEMEYEEFSNLLYSNFKFVTIYYQQFEKNSVISGGGNKTNTVFSTSALEKTNFENSAVFIAVCSNKAVEIPALNSVLSPGTRDIFNNYDKVIKWGNELDEIIIKQKADLKYLYDKAETLEKDCTELKENLSSLNSEKSDLIQATEDLKTNYATLEKSYSELKAECDKLEEEKLSAIAACQRLEEEKSSALADCVKLEEEKSVLDSQIKELQDEHANIVSGLKSAISSLEKIVQLREFELNNIRRNKVYQLLSATYKLLKRIKQKLKGAAPAAVVPDETVVIPENSIEENTLVSIIIPVYNNYDYLRTCFDSALRQTYKNVEIITVNDCSPDERVKPLLEEYASKYPNFYTYDNVVNQGICITTNIAMEKANGTWFAFLDCDDWLADDAVERLMKKISEKNTALFGYSNRYNFDNDTKTCEEIDFQCRPTYNYLENLEIGMYVTHLKIVHKSVFERIGTFDPEYDGVQDYDIALKAAFYFGDSIFSFLREPIYYHRVHSSQTTTVQNTKLIIRTQQLVENSKKRQAIRNGTYNKKISFIVLSFNKAEQTKECIESIYKTVKIPFEIILFDNKSNDDAIRYIKEFTSPLKEVKTYFSDTNIGCGRGRQAALKYATGDYFVMIDNDIILTPDWLPEMIVRLEREDKVAAVCAKVVFPDQKVQFNSLSRYINEPFITFALDGYMEPASEMKNCSYENIQWLPGGATIYKSGILDSVTGLEEYINCYEDNETSHQLQKKGYILLNSPASVMIHNHFTYMGNKVEKEYTEARYNRENLIKSAFAFYRRNGLIIKDNSIFDLMGLAGKSDDEIIAHFKKMLQDEKNKA